jgi:hypothetical protein
MPTFLNLQDDTLERLNLPSDASSTARTRVKRYLNEGYRAALGGVGLSRARYATTTITTVAGTAEYSVTATKVRSIRDEANELLLTEATLHDLRAMDPGETSSGTSTYYAVYHYNSTTTLKVRLWPIPSEVLTLDVEILAPVTELSADGDLPLLPADYHYLLSVYARMCEYEKMDDTRAQQAAQQWRDGLKDLRFFLRKSDTRATIQGGRPRGYSSSLGPDFPDRQ